MRAPTGLTAGSAVDKQYQELRGDIKSLAQNLDYVKNIVQNASLHWQRTSPSRVHQLRGTAPPKEWELL